MMAERTITNEFNQQLLRDCLTCDVCLERYTNPKLLTCHHSFCTTCIERLPQELEVFDENSYTTKDIYINCY